MIYILILVCSFIQFVCFSAKTLLVTKGSKVRSSILASLDVLAWGIGGGGLVTMLLFDNPYVLIPFLIGSTSGFIGSMEFIKKHSNKKTTVIVMSKNESSDIISSSLVKENYGITELEGTYKNKVLVIATKGGRIKELKKIIKGIDKSATIVTNSRVSIHGGYLY